MITVHNPKGAAVDIDPEDVVLVFFSAFLSPPGANSNAVYRGSIRSFAETDDVLATAIKATDKLVLLTLPPGPGSAKSRPIWISVPRVQDIDKAPRNGSSIMIKGQKGPVRVQESPEEVKKAIAQA